MSFFHPSTTNAKSQPNYTGMQLQTSAYGVPIPVVYGTSRISWNLGDYVNFMSVQKPSSGSSGGKGGVVGGGGKGSGGTTTTYTASILGTVCEGPITGIYSSWSSQTQSPGTPNFSIFNGSLAQAPWTYLSSNYPSHALSYSGIAYAAAENYDLGNSANLPSMNWEVEGFLCRSTPSTYGGNGCYAGGDADPSLVVPDMLTSAQYGMGFPANRVGDVVSVDETHVVPGGGGGITVTYGASWYFGINVTTGGVSGLLKCVTGVPGPGQYSITAGGLYTFNIAQAGATVSIRYAIVTTLARYQNFAMASGLWISPAYTSQTQMSSCIDDLMTGTFSEVVWSSGVLQVVPRGSRTITGNGYTFIPPSTPLFSLGVDDLMPGTGNSADPVTVTRSRVSDQLNVIKVECLDRANQYAVAIAEASDQALVDRYGRRPNSSQSLHYFCDLGAANTSAKLQLQDQYIRNKYAFNLDERYVILDPMDIVEITDPNYSGMTNVPVRILEMTENDDGTISVIAEEYPGTIGKVPSFTVNVGVGLIQDFNVDPGDTDAPAIFDVPVQLAQVLGLESWIAAHSATGNPNWGGCDVYLSTDNAIYSKAGTILGPSRMGTLTATFPTGSDPDTTHTLSVDLSESFGELESGTAADADQGVTQCFVDGEYVSYQTAALTSTYHYDLGTYLRRGQWGSQIASHAIGSLFVRLDERVFKLPYNKTDVGKTIYVKLQSFNIYGSGYQDLSSLTAYSHTIGGPPAIYAPTGIAATSTLKGVSLAWVNPANVGIAAVEIWRSATSSFGAATHIADAPAYATTYLDQTVASNTQYWYWIRCRDISGNEGSYDPSSGGAGATATAGQTATADISNLSITGPKIASGAIDGTKFAAGLTPVQVVSSLPASANEGDTAVLTTDGKLYRYHSGAWTAAVPTVDLTGTISNAQIAAGAIDLNKVASGLTFIQILSSLPGSATQGQTVLLTTDNKLYRYTGSAWTSVVPAADITGQLTDSQLAAIAAAKVTGQITTTQITNNSITTAKVAAGAITTNEIAASTIVAGNIAASTITGTQIAANTITAAKIAAATITSNEIASNTIVAGNIQAATITGALIAAGTITAANIAALTITANELAANSVTAGKVDANAITAGTIAVGAINAGAIIVSNIIVTGHLTANSVTSPNVASAGSSTMPQFPTFGTLVSVTITTVGGPVLLSFTDWFQRSSGHSPQCKYHIDNATLSTTLLDVESGGSGVPAAMSVSGSWLDTSVSGSPGTYTYNLTVTADNGDPACVSKAPVITATELKR